MLMMLDPNFVLKISFHVQCFVSRGFEAIGFTVAIIGHFPAIFDVFLTKPHEPW